MCFPPFQLTGVANVFLTVTVTQQYNNVPPVLLPRYNKLLFRPLLKPTAALSVILFIVQSHIINVTSPLPLRGRCKELNPVKAASGNSVVVYQSSLSLSLSLSLLAQHGGSVDLKGPLVVFAALGISSYCALTHSSMSTSPCG